MTPDDRTDTHTPQPADPPTGSLSPSLDAGLAAAFGPESTPGGWSRPPLLRDDSSENAPLVQPGSPEVPRGGNSRYQLLGEIARGGMGVVLKGRDPDLGRDLAVKVLKADLAGRPAAEQRFVEEAQVGGQLQHPGVVPVYDLGRFADGRPYFAMKLVKGRTLADLLAERPDPSADRGRFLQHFLQVCQTIAYAHAKGVIHRDLKPSNIMVGSFGEVLVMDWGLAKVLPRGGVADELKASRERQRPTGATAEPTVIHTARAGIGGTDTLAGSVMGTPAFMPPEQAGGEVEKLDERADVFGLGAILCVTLTGEPPYVAESGEAVRLMAVRGDLEAAFARLDGCGTDAELVALCKRCLAAKRESRPRHAGEVAGAMAEHLAGVEQRAHAAEVERAAADARAAEAVNTRREAEAKAAAERRRRRAQAVLGSAVTLVVLVGGAAAGWQWLRADRALNQVTAEQEKTAEALAKAKEEQARTFAALNTMTDEGVERLFQAQLEMGDEQKAFVQKVIALYDQATQTGQDTPEGRARRAEGHLRVGRLRERTDDHAGGIADLQAAIGLYTALATQFPDERNYRFQLALCRSYLGRTYTQINRNREAEEETRGAIELLRPLIAADGGNLEYQFELTRAQINRGRALGVLNRRPEAIAETRAAVPVLRALCERDPANRQWAMSLPAAYLNIASYLTDKPAEMEQAAREAVAAADVLQKRFPADPMIHGRFAGSHNNLGMALFNSKKVAAAAAEFRIARDAHLEIARRYPMVREYRRELAHGHSNLAATLAHLNRSSEAAAEDAAAVAVFTRLIAEDPKDRSYRAPCLSSLGRLLAYHLSLRTADAAEAAEGHARAALKLVDEVLATDPADREYRLGFVRWHEALGRALSDQNRHADAVAEFRTALASLDALMAEPPGDPSLLALRGQARFNLGRSLKSLGQRADTAAAYRSSLADFEAVARRDPKDFSARDMTARCHREFAYAYSAAKDLTQADAEFRFERDIRIKLVADSSTPEYRQELGLVAQMIGSYLKRLDRHVESEPEFRAAVDIFRKLVAEFPKNVQYQHHLAMNLMYFSHARIQQRDFAGAEKLAAEADPYFVEVYRVASTNREVRAGYALNTSYLALGRARGSNHRSAGELLARSVALDPNSAMSYHNAACILGHCVLAAERDAALTDQQRKDLVAEYTDRALGYLRRSVELDRTDRTFVSLFRADKDLDPFRGHPEFKKILAEVEQPLEKGPPPRGAKQ